MKKVELRKNSKGQTLYPVCSWEKNQQALYNAHDRTMNKISDVAQAGEDTSPLWKKLSEIERLMGIFDGQVYDGLVYATWEDSQAIKNYVGGYNARH